VSVSRAVIFDFNGVIVDDEHLHARAFAVTLAEQDVALDEREYFDVYLGLDDRELLRAVLRDKAGRKPTAEELDTFIARKAEAYLSEIEAGVDLFAGAADLIVDLSADLPLAVASGARRHEIERILGDRDLLRLFTAVVSADDVAKSKPDPAPYLAALEALRRHGHPELQASHCIVIEDAPAGIEAATAAGMICIGVCSSRRPEELSRARVVVDSLSLLSAATVVATF
jgi:HAD superfamily hydrolase (TIGR01509 family)